MEQDFYSECKQCPRACKVNRSQQKSGFCGETDEVKIATACLHFGEEPLITVFGGSGTIFLTGCTLHCAFCQNYQISQQGMGSSVNSETFTQMCLKLQSLGAENINLVTGSHHIPKIAQFLKDAKNTGLTIPVAWNSSAYESVEMLEQLKGLVDIWLPDLKTLNPIMSKELFAAEDYPVVAKRAIRWMIENTPMNIVEVEGVPKDSSAKSGAENTSSAKKGASDKENISSAKSGASGAKTEVREKMLSGTIIRHLVLPGRMSDTQMTLDWLKKHADSKACISLMSQYTPVPFKGSQTELAAREKALSAFPNRLIDRREDSQLRRYIDEYDFEYLFYQELSDDTDWLPDFTRCQPFSNKLATPVWHWNNSFLN